MTSKKLPDKGSPMLKYNEEAILKSVEAYIRSTYEGHYASKGVQVLDLLEASGCVTGYLRGSAIKYASRYGKKNGKNKMDLLKAIHCLVLLINFEEGNET